MYPSCHEVIINRLTGDVTKDLDGISGLLVRDLNERVK